MDVSHGLETAERSLARAKRLWKQRDLLQPGILRPVHHQIHVLNRLPRSALHQIVERRDHDRAAGHAILGDADEGHVGTATMPRLRRLAERKYMRERPVGVIL